MSGQVTSASRAPDAELSMDVASTRSGGRFVTLGWIIVALLSLAGCHAVSNTRTFAGPACPSGWEFRYSDHLQRKIICERDTSAVVAGVASRQQ